MSVDPLSEARYRYRPLGESREAAGAQLRYFRVVSLHIIAENGGISLNLISSLSM